MEFDPRTILVPLMFLTLVGCGPDEPVEPEPPPAPSTGTLKLVMRPTWNGAPFVMNEIYNNVNDYRVKVEGIKFYLGDVRLLNGSGNTLVKDIAFFDLRYNGDTVTWTGVQPGIWSGLSAGFGVPQALNDADPIVYPPGHPLDLANGSYWTWATAYRFFQFDGRYDLDGSGTAPPTAPFSMHTGLNACYQEFNLDLGGDIVVTAGSTSTLVIDMAVDKVFYTATDTVDLATENQTHGTNLPVALELTNCAVQSFSVE